MKIRFVLCALVGGMSFFGTMASASVWNTTRHWDLAAEEEFGRWISGLSVDVFDDPQSPYHGLATDCAKAVYALRIIFASEHGLPVRFQDRTDLSNSSSEFDAEGGRRVMLFIDHVLSSTNSMTLTRDTYAVQIDRNFIRPGTMFLHNPPRDGSVKAENREGHVYYLKSVPSSNLIVYMSSTVPIAVRPLSLRYGINFAPVNKQSGYRVWRWPDSAATPGASEEQFTLANWHSGDFNDNDGLWESWQSAILEKLGGAPSGAEAAAAATQNLRVALEERIQAVNKGWAVYQNQYGGTGCMSERAGRGSEDYSGYSTPNRDRKVRSEIDNYIRTVGLSGFSIEVVPGHVMTISQLNEVFNDTDQKHRVLAMSEPEHNPLVRWGLEDQGRWPCPRNAYQYEGSNLIRP